MRTITESSDKDKGFSIDLSISRDDKNLDISRRDLNIQEVRTNYDYWNRTSNVLSSNNYDSADFRKIVDMGEDAVPGILEIIKDHPDPVVHALDLIYPGYMTYNGYVSLEDVCRTWIITLIALGKA
ncbi:MAG: hypothetical protein J6J93_09860 [Muribaculaceae bacterium]|nr:hypothetical protein [Muribaculaceae bacterium]